MSHVQWYPHRDFTKSELEHLRLLTATAQQLPRAGPSISAPVVGGVPPVSAAPTLVVVQPPLVAPPPVVSPPPSAAPPPVKKDRQWYSYDPSSKPGRRRNTFKKEGRHRAEASEPVVQKEPVPELWKCVLANCPCGNISFATSQALNEHMNSFYLPRYQCSGCGGLWTHLETAFDHVRAGRCHMSDPQSSAHVPVICLYGTPGYHHKVLQYPPQAAHNPVEESQRSIE
ncbi:hypothetical protein BC835DRAFT_667522 [Cytidiella melzeri]|nr:hypothetical protein BC835DRAFT_667522 [Cytidiella melzeri]